MQNSPKKSRSAFLHEKIARRQFRAIFDFSTAPLSRISDTAARRCRKKAVYDEFGTYLDCVKESIVACISDNSTSGFNHFTSNCFVSRKEWLERHNIINNSYLGIISVNYFSSVISAAKNSSSSSHGAWIMRMLLLLSIARLLKIGFPSKRGVPFP